MGNKGSIIKGSIAAVFGAAGGIGGAVCAELYRGGAEVVGLGRHPERIQKEFHGRAVDLNDPASLEAALDALLERLPDIVVIAAGYDVRKPFLAHDEAEIARSVSTNYLSLVAICRRLLPGFTARGSGSIVYVGGFGDGSLAFPFHSVDASTRAAAASFLESLGRESASGLRFLYFGPPAVRTTAEEAYLEQWRKIGVPIVSPERVARRLTKAIERGERSVAMGLGTRAGIVANALSTRLMDVLFMNAYRDSFARAFGGGPRGEL